MRRAITRKSKMQIIREHTQEKLGAGVTDPGAFSNSTILRELAHFRFPNARLETLTKHDIHGFFRYHLIDRKKIGVVDLKKLKPLPRGALVSKAGIIRRAPQKKYAFEGERAEKIRAWGSAKNKRDGEKRLFKLGVFKPRRLKKSVFVLCKRKCDLPYVRPVDRKRAERILHILEETEDKAMPIPELEKTVAWDSLFPKSNPLRRPIAHLKDLGIINAGRTMRVEWIAVSEKFAIVDDELLNLKLKLLRLQTPLKYMGRVVSRKYSGYVPPTINPDGAHISDISGAISKAELSLNRSPLGKKVLDNIDTFPRHLLGAA